MADECIHAKYSCVTYRKRVCNHFKYAKGISGQNNTEYPHSPGIERKIYAGIPILWICVKQQALFYPSMLAILGSAVLQAAGLQVSEELILPACVCPWTAVSISGLVEVDTFYYWICLVSIFLCGLVGFIGAIISFENQDQ